MFEYTICFIKRGNQILLLNREKTSGWMGSWNGVGGKIEKGETPYNSIIREVVEETGIKLLEAEYKGDVTWENNGKDFGGMYVFLAEVPTNFEYKTPKKVEEGILDWKNIEWILHPKNTGIALNIPKFLPKILENDEIYEHRCYFENDHLKKVEIVREIKGE
jgi:8-oxo-dGTP diphosphatase